MSNKFDSEFARAAAQAKANTESMIKAAAGYADRNYAPQAALAGCNPVDDGPAKLTNISLAIVNGGFIVHFEHNRYMPMRPTVAKDVDELIDLIRSAVKRE